MTTLLAFLLLLTPAARAEIREIKSMAEIKADVDEDTLLVFDIDNTLVEPVGNVGSDQWYYYIVKALHRDGLSEDEADARATAAWSWALENVPSRPVEALTPGLIRELQKRGARTLGLTARGPENAAATRGQFRKADIDLAARTVGAAKGSFTDGVLFVGDGPDKGQALVAFLAERGLRPAKVVFVDDKPKHVQNVDRALAEAKIPCVAFRYGAADAKVRAFLETTAEADSPAKAELLFHGRLPAQTPKR